MESQKMSWARRKIETAIKQNGPYSHNICSLALSAVAQVDGREAANRLIREYSLDRLYSIQAVED